MMEMNKVKHKETEWYIVEIATNIRVALVIVPYRICIYDRQLCITGMGTGDNWRDAFKNARQDVNEAVFRHRL